MARQNHYVNPIADKSDIGFLEFVLKVLYERDRSDLADELIERFGSVAGVFHATRSELMSVRGITERVALFFTFVSSMDRQATLRDLSTQPLNSEKSILRFCSAFFSLDTEPVEACIYLDDEQRLIAVNRITSKEPMREILISACRQDARTVIRIGYSPAPNMRDHFSQIDPTDFIETLNIVGIALLDHIIYSPPDFFSLLRHRNNGTEYIPISNASNVPYPISYSHSLLPNE